MSGLGTQGDSSKGGHAPPMRKSMGIQFVKSSETLKLEDNNSALNHNCKANAAFSGIKPASQNHAPVSLMSLSTTNISPRSVKQAPIPFGGPAQNFTHERTGNNKNSGSMPYCGQSFRRAGGVSSANRGVSGLGTEYRMPGQVSLNKGPIKGGAQTNNYPTVTEAKPVSSVNEYLTAWKTERDADLVKIRKLAYEVVTLKTDRPNAKDKLHSAANRVPLRIEFNTEPVFGAKNNNSFLCYVFIESISIASGQGAKIKDAKTNAYEAALQKVLMPYLRIVQLDPNSRELQVSRQQFMSPPPEPSKIPLSKPSAFQALQSGTSSKDSAKEIASQHKESNMEAAGLKRRFNEYKQLDEFVIVEPIKPIPDCTPAHTLRRSADFNHMLLEYEYFFKGEAARCILRIENQVLADVNGISKAASKNVASAQALLKLKKFCWIIKTKQAVDSNTKISKEEMLNELNEQSDTISHDNIGNKLLRKMGWSGGGVGKDGSGIAEPVSLKSVLNREGLGLSAAKGVTDEFRRRIKEVIENYAASDNQEDLVFSCDFRLEERQIIHDECRRLNLRSKSRGKGQKRYLCVRRKRSVNQLFDHLMFCGGETARYRLVPPGQDTDGQRQNFEPVGKPGQTAVSLQQNVLQTQITGRTGSSNGSGSLLGSSINNSPHSHSSFEVPAGSGFHFGNGDGFMKPSSGMSQGGNYPQRSSASKLQGLNSSSGFSNHDGMFATTSEDGQGIHKQIEGQMQSQSANLQNNVVSGVPNVGLRASSNSSNPYNSSGDAFTAFINGSNSRGFSGQNNIGNDHCSSNNAMSFFSPGNLPQNMFNGPHMNNGFNAQVPFNNFQQPMMRHMPPGCQQQQAVSPHQQNMQHNPQPLQNFGNFPNNQMQHGAKTAFNGNGDNHFGNDSSVPQSQRGSMQNYTMPNMQWGGGTPIDQQQMGWCGGGYNGRPPHGLSAPNNATNPQMMGSHRQ